MLIASLSLAGGTSGVGYPCCRSDSRCLASIHFTAKQHRIFAQARQGVRHRLIVSTVRHCSLYLLAAAAYG